MTIQPIFQIPKASTSSSLIQQLPRSPFHWTAQTIVLKQGVAAASMLANAVANTVRLIAYPLIALINAAYDGARWAANGVSSLFSRKISCMPLAPAVKLQTADIEAPDQGTCVVHSPSFVSTALSYATSKVSSAASSVRETVSTHKQGFIALASLLALGILYKAHQKGYLVLPQRLSHAGQTLTAALPDSLKHPMRLFHRPAVAVGIATEAQAQQPGDAQTQASTTRWSSWSPRFFHKKTV